MGEISINIRRPEEGKSCNSWGVFRYSGKMPWGQWFLTSKPEVLFSVGDIEVLECSATELIQDEQGCVPQGTIEYDPCSRFFLVGRRANGEVIWWHNLVAEYDLKNRRFAENSITLEENKIIVKGYGGNYKRKIILIDVNTGAKSVI